MGILPEYLVSRFEISYESLLIILYPICLLPITALWYFERQNSKRLKTRPKGCRRLGLRDFSNLSDEYNDSKYGVGSEASGQPGWKVKALVIHPIKSCAPVELHIAEINGSGLAWDRQFAFAELLTPQVRLDATEAEKKPRWTFRTLRQPGYEKLVTVRPEVWVPDAIAVRNMTQSKPDKHGILVINYPNIPSGPLKSLLRFGMIFGLVASEKSFQAPLNPPADHKYPSDDVVIWKDSPRWLNYGVHVPDDFKAYLGITNPFTMFRVDPSNYREVHRNAPKKEILGYQPIVGFADAYPIHMLNLTSVRDIAKKVRVDIPKFSARRFRSNIVVAGPAAYDEDDWKRVRIGGQEFYCACHTVRCRLPNVDPDSSERHPVEPDKMLKSFRCIDEGDPKNACLGLQLVPASQAAQIKVGDTVEVLERGEHYYIRQ